MHCFITYCFTDIICKKVTWPTVKLCYRSNKSDSNPESSKQCYINLECVKMLIYFTQPVVTIVVVVVVVCCCCYCCCCCCVLASSTSGVDSANDTADFGDRGDEMMRCIPVSIPHILHRSSTTYAPPGGMHHHHHHHHHHFLRILNIRHLHHFEFVQ